MRNIVYVVFILGFMSIGKAYGQTSGEVKEMAHHIDSIAKVRQIQVCHVYVYRISTDMSKEVKSSIISLERKEPFKIEGGFLVVGYHYYNLARLNYFYVNEKNIEFYLSEQ